VAVWAHIGGFIGGLILLEVLRPRRRAALVSY
jgi:membrane associated rhomboid family serine protease